MNRDKLNKIGRELYSASTRMQQITCPTLLCPNMTSDDAYTIGEAMIREYEANGHVFAGKKIGYTLNSLWDELGINSPSYGCILKDRIFYGLEEISYDKLMEPRLEFEIVFILKSGLNTPDIDAQHVLDATDYVAAAFEIIEFRTLPNNRKVLDVIADNASFGACLAGTRKIRPQLEEISTQSVNVYKNGSFVEEGLFRNVMGSPVNSVVWLANLMVRRQTPLKAGDVILSGSSVSPINIARGDIFEAKYSTFGSISIKFL